MSHHAAKENNQYPVSYTHLDVYKRQIISYMQYLFCNADNAYLSFEQSAEGTHITINGVDVYVGENENRTICVWREQLSVTNLVGKLSQEEMISLLHTVLEE